MFRRLMVIGLLGVSGVVFALMFETSTAEAWRGCRGRRAYRSRAYYAPSYYRPRVSVGVGFYGGYGGGFGHGFYGGHGGFGGHGFYGGHGGFGH